MDDVTSLSREKIIERIKEAGVVGMGGAGFPTHVKLSPKEPEKSSISLQTARNASHI